MEVTFNVPWTGDKPMADTPPVTPPTSVMPYIWAALILFLTGVILIGLILYMRPTYDPLIVIGAVGGMITTFIGVIATFIKSQETHLTVNSQLTAWKAEYQALRLAEGRIEGAKTEQERVAEQLRIGALIPPKAQTLQEAAVPPPAFSVVPVPVSIVGAPAVDGHVPVTNKGEVKT